MNATKESSMRKLLLAFAAAGLAATLSGSVTANAKPRIHGITTTLEHTDISARRYWRHRGWGPRRVWWGPRYRYWGPRYRYWGPRRVWAGPRYRYWGPRYRYWGPRYRYWGPRYRFG